MSFDIINLIGNTPIVELNNYCEKKGLKTRIFAKLEGKNPFGSIKDRVALALIEDAEKKGLLKKGYTIIEPTSGNTGIALAAIAAIKNYNIIIVMPSNMSTERIALLKLYGAKVILTPGKDGINGAIKKANEISKQIKNSYIPNQFSNISNSLVHEVSTAKEILRSEIKFDYIVIGVGTGGTLTGVGRALKKSDRDIKIVAVEPKNSAVISGEKPGFHEIQGIGAGFIPDICDVSLIDRIEKISDNNAFDEVKFLAKAEGLLVGISSGAVLHAAYNVAKMSKSQKILAIFPDFGEKYLSNYISKI